MVAYLLKFDIFWIDTKEIDWLIRFYTLFMEDRVGHQIR